MRHLFKVDDGVTYWVIAESSERAIESVLEQDRDDGGDPPAVMEKCTRQSLSGCKFTLDGCDTNASKFSMWDAYQIAHVYGDGVLACSEW